MRVRSRGSDKPGGCCHHPLPTALELFRYMGERKEDGFVVQWEWGVCEVIYLSAEVCLC